MTDFGVTSEELLTFTDQPSSVLARRPSYMGIVSMIELVFGLVFHILALLAIRKARQLWGQYNRTSVPHFLFNALRIIDFCAVIFFILRGCVSPFSQLSVLFRCEFGVSTNLFFTTASGLANVAMCMERCVALLAPFIYRKHVTLFKAKVSIAVTVGIAFLFSILPFLGVSSYRYESDGTIFCVAPGDLVYDVDLILVHTIMFFIIGFSTVLCIVVCNFMVVYFIVKLSKTIVPSIAVRKIPEIVTSQNEVGSTSEDTPQSNPDEVSTQSEVVKVQATDLVNQRKHDIQLASMFIVVSIIYTISWLPLQIERLMAVFQIERPEILFVATVWLVALNHVVDPVVFVCFKNKNRQALKILFLDVCCCLFPTYRDKVRENTMSLMAPNFML